MSRATWKGTLGFGLVMLPVKLHKASETASSTMHFMHREDSGRIRNQRVCEVCGETVEWADLARGIELPDGTLSLITEDEAEDLAAARGEQTAAKACEVLHFTTEDSLDPVQFGPTYYVEPDKGGEGAYALLRDAMVNTERVGVCKFRMREKESLAALRVHGDVMLLSVLLWPEEVRQPDFGFLRGAPVKVNPAQVDMAQQLIMSMDMPFDPTAHRDSYRAALSDLVAAKSSDRPAEVKVNRRAAAKAQPDALLAALQASLASKGAA